MYRYKKLKIEGKCIDEHRHIMQQHIKRKLNRNEVVHHINGNKRDNSIENLEIKTRSEHSREHYFTGDSNNLEKANSARRRKVKVVDGVDMYECSKCRLFLLKDSFDKSRNKLYGICHLCKKCVYIYKQRYRKYP